MNRTRFFNGPFLIPAVFACLNLFVGNVFCQVFDPGYFGAHVHRSVPNSLWKQVGFGSIRLHDANVTWAELEPAKGRWQFDRLDKIVENAKSANVNILLPLNATPTWASSNPTSADAYGAGTAAPPVQMIDWENYVSTVVNRYKGRIKAYEIWNEPNLKQFFTGSPKEMAELTIKAAAVIRAADPSAQIVCAAITGSYGPPWLKQYFQAGAGKHCDVIGYHFYTSHQPPEKMLPTILTVKKLMVEFGLENKPLWNTETGWLIANGGNIDVKAAGFNSDAKILSADEAASYIPRALLLARSTGVDRFYWYSWDHPSMGMSAGRGIGWARAGRVYSEFLKLTSGAKVLNCASANSIWTCNLQLKNGTGLDAIWSESKEITFKATRTGELLRIAKFGEIEVVGIVKSGDQLTASGDPVFIREVP